MNTNQSLHLKWNEAFSASTNLCQTLSDQSPCGNPGCPYERAPTLRGSAAELAASAGTFAPSLRSPAGADSSGLSLQVSKKWHE